MCNPLEKLFDAIDENDLVGVNDAIAAGARVDLDFMQDSPLRAMLRANDNYRIPIAKALIAAGADVNRNFEQGMTILAKAIKTDRNNHDIISFLIENGANINAIDDDRNSILELAARWQHDADNTLLKKLIAMGAMDKLNDWQKCDLLIEASSCRYKGRSDVLRFLADAIGATVVIGRDMPDGVMFALKSKDKWLFTCGCVKLVELDEARTLAAREDWKKREAVVRPNYYSALTEITDIIESKYNDKTNQ